MEILIRKVENNRATNKRVGGRRSGKREIYIERMGVGAWHLGKTNKIYILLKSFRILACCHLHALLAFAFLVCLCLVPCALCPCLLSARVPCVRSVCLCCSLSCSAGSLYNFIFNTKFCFITLRTRTGLCNLQAK